VKKGARLAVCALVGLGAVGGAMWEYRSYTRRAASLEGEIARYRGAMAERDSTMGDKGKISRTLKKASETTLGTNEEHVSAALRKALNEVVTHYRLADASVTSARPMALKNPAAQKGLAELRDRKWKEAKGTPDFYVLPATINGKGTLDQAVRVLATLEAQPWVHKIDSFSIRPLGQARDRVELTVSLGTMYMADAGGAGVRAGEGVKWSPVSEAAYAAWQPLVSKNVFAEPPAPAPVAAAAAAPAPAVASAPPPPPPPPPAPAYEQWRVTGVTMGAQGPELMVVNLQTRQWLTLLTGGVVLDARFTGAVGETARISIGDKEFEVKTGQALSERTPVSR
jgi:hypothetical protein